MSFLVKNYNEKIFRSNMEGSYLFSTNGKKYLDFVRIAVNSLGHASKLVKTIRDQSKNFACF